MPLIPSGVTNTKPVGLPTIRIDSVDDIKKAHKDKIRFSFKFFDRVSEYFTLAEAPQSWFITLFDELKEISKHNWVQFKNDLKSKYDPHPIDWETESVTSKFPFDNIDQYFCVQFRLSLSKGRVAGFLLGNIFYIIWLDHKHFLYSSKDGKGFERPYKMPPAKTCYDKLQDDFNNLKDENKKVTQERNELYDLLDKQTLPTKPQQ
jgi:hypothetical protein